MSEQDNREKSIDCMVEIDTFMFDLQNKWDAATLMRAMCWSMGRWIGATHGNMAFVTLGECINQIAWSVSRRKEVETETPQ
jgi:hypothetical protein